MVVERPRPPMDERDRHDSHGIAIAVRGIALPFEQCQAQAQQILFAGATLLRLDAALDALAHRVGLAPDIECALPGRDRVFAIHLPGALGHRRGRRPVGQHQAAIGFALLVDLRCRRRVGDGRAVGGADDEGDEDRSRAEVQLHDRSRRAARATPLTVPLFANSRIGGGDSPGRHQAW